MSMPGTVLIETLWNVKTDGHVDVTLDQTVLIETLWNVKYTADKIYVTLCRGINRNIVECKA